MLLGGDNMDLALAHACEEKLGQKLEPARFGQLVLACRSAKEALLGEEPPEDIPVTVLGAGRKLVGGALSVRLPREDVERVVLEGFLPKVPREAKPEKSRSALVAFGLPYERDAAITRKVPTREIDGPRLRHRCRRRHRLGAHGLKRQDQEHA